MKKMASFFLVSGLLIIALALSIAVSAMNGINDIHTQTVTDESPTSCLFCHVEPHADWNLVNTVQQSTLETQSDVTESNNAPVCSSCHVTMTDTENLSLEEVQLKISSTQGRVAALRQALTNFIAEHATGWDSSASRSEKSAEQIMAERISTLVAVIEADGSWGFHDPTYTEEILSEAETLMAEVVSHAGA